MTLVLLLSKLMLLLRQECCHCLHAACWHSCCCMPMMATAAFASKLLHDRCCLIYLCPLLAMSELLLPGFLVQVGCSHTHTLMHLTVSPKLLSAAQQTANAQQLDIHHSICRTRYAQGADIRCGSVSEATSFWKQPHCTVQLYIHREACHHTFVSFKCCIVMQHHVQRNALHSCSYVEALI